MGCLYIVIQWALLLIMKLIHIVMKLQKEGPTSMNHLSKMGLTLLLFTALVTACATNEQESTHNHNTSESAQHDHLEHAANGDLREWTASADILPTFLAEKDEKMQLVYQLSAQYHEVLQWMPCYCGCGESAGHGSNLNCFVHEIRDDGSIQWDDHGTRCNVCLDIAIIAIDI